MPCLSHRLSEPSGWLGAGCGHQEVLWLQLGLLLLTGVAEHMAGRWHCHCTTQLQAAVVYHPCGRALFTVTEVQNALGKLSANRNQFLTHLVGNAVSCHLAQIAAMSF